MTVYWLLLFYFAVGAFLTSANWQRASTIDPFFRFGAIAVVILIGFRYWIGGDWPQYERIFSFAGYASLPQVITMGDPGYQILNWVTRRLGLEIWAVNLICGGIYAAGLFKLARLQPNPWLAIAVAIPYLIIVVGMGYTRQSVALGFVMIGLAGLMRGSTAYRYVAFIILATLFHRSAVVMTLVLAAGHRTRFTNLLIGASVAYVLYDLIVSSAFPALSQNYLEAGYEAQGAAVRVFMNFLPAALFMLTPTRFGFDEREIGIVRIMAIAGLVFPILLFAVPSSAAVDRLALYISPLQMIILSRIPGALIKEDFGKVIILAYAAAVQFVWLNFAFHARDWVPYRFWFLDTYGRGWVN